MPVHNSSLLEINFFFAEGSGESSAGRLAGPLDVTLVTLSD